MQHAARPRRIRAPPSAFGAIRQTVTLRNGSLLSPRIESAIQIKKVREIMGHAWSAIWQFTGRRFTMMSMDNRSSG
jgi:hypothetical protein